MRITFSTHGIDRLMKKITREFAMLSICFAIFAGLVFYLISRPIVREVSELAITARQVGRGDLELRARPGNLPETRALALAFNTMLDSLEASRKAFERVNQKMVQQKALAKMGSFSLMIAHEVKNPLSIINSSLDVLIKELSLSSNNTMVVYIKDEIKRLNRLIEDFLMFARPVKPTIRSVDLNEMLRDIVKRFEIQRQGLALDIESRIPLEPCNADADKDLLKPAVIGNSDSIEVGQFVVAIGNPFGLQNSMSTGIVSGLGRLLPTSIDIGGSATYSIPDMIQTDAAINPGNSGGPLLNLQGEVIGMNTAIESPVRSNSGVGYAIPSVIIEKVVPQLIDNGSVSHPWLGISGSELNASLAESLGLSRSQRGIAIGDVIAEGPADIAGLQPANAATGLGGDVIIGVDNQEVKEFDDLLGYIVEQARVGQTINLLILRDGKELTIPVTLGERPS